MIKSKIKIVRQVGAIVPEFATEFSAGADLYAFLKKPKAKEYIEYKGDKYSIDISDQSDHITIKLKPGGRVLIPTGIKMAIPVGYEAQIRPRSGNALKKGLTVLNAPGTIDADYRGDIGVILYNSSEEVIHINHGDRIAQLIVSAVCDIEFEDAEKLPDTKRGEGGFGHTG